MKSLFNNFATSFEAIPGEGLYGTEVKGKVKTSYGCLH